MGTDRYLRVEGIKPANTQFDAMKGVYDACKKAGISPPVEVLEFFDNREPVAAGVCLHLLSRDVGRDIGAHNYEMDGITVVPVSISGDSSLTTGYVIDLSTLPDDVKLLRVTVETNW